MKPYVNIRDPAFFAWPFAAAVGEMLQPRPGVRKASEKSLGTFAVDKAHSLLCPNVIRGEAFVGVRMHGANSEFIRYWRHRWEPSTKVWPHDTRSIKRHNFRRWYPAEERVRMKRALPAGFDRNHRANRDPMAANADENPVRPMVGPPLGRRTKSTMRL